MTGTPPASSHTRAMAWWLVICAAMVFAMVVLGGATRLTESGLSMVEWKPLTILPPLNDAQWQAEFQNYQQTPEYQIKNNWMTVDDFKEIFRLEYIHRLWGRVIGMVFALPFLWFLYRRAVDRSLGWKLAGLFVLGGAQGALGWFMVASGLQDRPDVSQYRLAAHLITAFILYACLVWVALDLFARLRPARPGTCTTLERLSLWLMPFVLLVVTAGAFVAGLDAGLIYNTFPLMEGQLIPRGLFAMSPWYLNIFENIMTVQFVHRVVAIALLIYICAMWFVARTSTLTARSNALMNAVTIMVFIQAGFGIATLLLVVPLPLALAHQSGALILLTLAVCLAHSLRTMPEGVPASAALHMKPAE